MPGDPASGAEEYLLTEELTIAFNPHAAYWLDVANWKRRPTILKLCSQISRFIEANCCPAFMMIGREWNASMWRMCLSARCRS